MIDIIKPIAESAAAIIELMGIGIMTLAAILVILYFAFQIIKRAPIAEVYDRVRLMLGKGVLLGLEFLVAADIIHTVAVELTFKTVGVLAIIVLIRTFLSVTLELELTGRWPWQGNHQSSDREI